MLFGGGSGERVQTIAHGICPIMMELANSYRVFSMHVVTSAVR